MSSEDVEKGQRWNLEMSTLLEQTTHGLICVTRENVGEPWLNFEAGALSRSVSSSRVRPVLLGISPTDLAGPLAQFQATSLADADDMLRLLRSLNQACDVPIDESRLEKAFNIAWKDLADALALISGQTMPRGQVQHRTTDEKIDEILGRLRGIEYGVQEARQIPSGERNFINVDLEGIDPSLTFVSLRVRPNTTVSDFLDELYDSVLGFVEPYTYGRTWALTRPGKAAVLRDMGSFWATENRADRDTRRLREAGLHSGERLLAVRLGDSGNPLGSAH